jgi:hypothetical protein
MSQRAESWWVVFVGSLGIANFAAFLRLAANTQSPPLPVTVAVVELRMPMARH